MDLHGYDAARPSNPKIFRGVRYNPLGRSHGKFDSLKVKKRTIEALTELADFIVASEKSRYKGLSKFYKP